MTKNKPGLILLFPEDQSGAAQLEQEVRKNNDCRVEIVITTPALLERLAGGDVNGLFASIRNFDLPFLNILGKAQSVCQGLLTVVLSDTIDQKAQSYLKRLEKVIHLEKPMSMDSIKIICERIVQGVTLHDRKHKRYNTNQMGALEILSGKQVLTCRIYNMSQGGAYLELDSGQVASNDVVRLTIQLSEIGKERVVHAKVAWTMPAGFVGKKFAVGLEFIHSNEAYLSVLEKG